MADANASQPNGGVLVAGPWRVPVTASAEVELLARHYRSAADRLEAANPDYANLANTLRHQGEQRARYADSHRRKGDYYNRAR